MLMTISSLLLCNKPHPTSLWPKIMTIYTAHDKLGCPRSCGSGLAQLLSAGLSRASVGSWQVGWRKDDVGWPHFRAWRSAGCWLGRLSPLTAASPAAWLGLIPLVLSMFKGSRRANPPNPRAFCAPACILLTDVPLSKLSTRAKPKSVGEGLRRREGENMRPFLQSEIVMISVMKRGFTSGGRGSGRGAVLSSGPGSLLTGDTGGTREQLPSQGALKSQPTSLSERSRSEKATGCGIPPT